MKKRKQPIILLFLFLILLGLGTIYLIQKASAGKTEETDSEETIELYSLDTDTAESLSFKNESGEVSLIKEEDTWYLKGNKEFAIDQAVVSSMLSTLSEISADRLVADEADNLEEYGLMDPCLEIYIELESGISTKIILGDEVPVRGGYYGMIDDQKQVYVMDSRYYFEFSVEKSDLELVEEDSE